MESQEKKAPVRDAFLRTLAVLGLIAILLLGAWGIIQLAVAIPSFLGNIGNNATSLFNRGGNTATSTKESIVVSAPASIGTGQTMQVSWAHNNAAAGAQYAYSISYACESGVTVKAVLPNGGYQAVPCNTAFNYTNANARTTLIATASGTTDGTLTVTVAASKLATGALAATGVAITKVTVAKATTSKPTTAKPSTSSGQTSKPASTYYAAPKPAALYGYGDLKVVMLSTNPSATGLTVITFEISNAGTNIVPAGWTFNASLPINGNYTFASQAQQQLNPGDKIVYTMQYSGGTNYPYNQYNTPYGYAGSSYYGSTGYTCNGYDCINSYQAPGYPLPPQYNYGYGYQSGTVVITADPMGYVQEVNKTNNTAQTTVALY